MSDFTDLDQSLGQNWTVKLQDFTSLAIDLSRGLEDSSNVFVQRELPSA